MEIFFFTPSSSPLSEEIFQLENACFPEEPWNKEQILSHMNNHPFLLGYISKEVFGYCLFTENKWEREILRMGILPEYRGKGWGKYLLGAFLENFPRGDVFLEVDETNKKAISLYEKMNFQLLDKRKGYYQNGNDALLYKKFSRENWNL